MINSIPKMVVSYLPQEILIDIFSRLPAKTVGKCRCLSKTWLTLLSTPQFIKSHLTQGALAHQENLIFITPFNSVHYTCDGAVSRKLEFLDNCVEVAGSCHGLVLLVDEENLKLLVNPTTQQHTKITDSPLALTKGESFSMYGLGYDRISDDYKIVALSYWDTDNEHNPDCADTLVDVYSVKRGVWKRADNSPYDHAVPQLSCGAFVNGAIHWLASSRERGYRSVIAAFDLADEVFDEIPAPTSVDEGKFVFYRLVVLKGWLCLVDVQSNGGADVWIMKEYGVGESWRRLRIEADYEYEIIKPVWFVGDEEEVVLLAEGETLVVYNVKEKMLRDMVVDGVSALCIDGGTFVQSLISTQYSSI